VPSRHRSRLPRPPRPPEVPLGKNDIPPGRGWKGREEKMYGRERWSPASGRRRWWELERRPVQGRPWTRPDLGFREPWDGWVGGGGGGEEGQPTSGHGHRQEASVEGLVPGRADACVPMGVARSGPSLESLISLSEMCQKYNCQCLRSPC
jgi:hypothetical protein